MCVTPINLVLTQMVMQKIAGAEVHKTIDALRKKIGDAPDQLFKVLGTFDSVLYVL